MLVVVHRQGLLFCIFQQIINGNAKEVGDQLDIINTGGDPIPFVDGSKTKTNFFFKSGNIGFSLPAKSLDVIENQNITSFWKMFLSNPLANDMIQLKGGENMDRSDRYALDAAKEMTIAKLSNANITINSESGKHVADFFEEIYKKVSEIAKEAAD